MIKANADDAGVAAAPTVAGHALFEDDNVKFGLELPKKVRRPEPGKSCTDNGNVRFDLSSERFTRLRCPSGQPVTGLLNRQRHGLNEMHE